MANTYRVVHCGSGQMGRRALRGIIDHPDLELVGQFVWSPDKLGVDCGVLAGGDPIGITATNDWEALYALNPDCLCDFGRSMPGQHDRWLGHTLPMLERGTNVVNFSAFEFAHPATAPAAEKAQIEAACAKGDSTFFFTGIDPGWATTDMAIAALAAADRVDCVRVQELGWWGQYYSDAMSEVFGFGLEPGATPGMLRDGKLKALWAPTCDAIADVLGAEIDDWESFFEVDTLDHDIEVGMGTVKAGTAVVLHFELRALSGGKPIVIMEHVDKIAHEAGLQWPHPHAPVNLVHRVEVEGDPAFSVEIAYRNGSAAGCTVMPVVNAIPAVVGARSGLLGPLDVPRYWARNVRKDARRVN